MIYGLSKDVAAKLKARKFPVVVLYGPERVTRERYQRAIVFQRDRKASDVVRATPGQHTNARRMRVRELCAQITLFVQSSLPGARVNDHEDVCEKLVDALIIALEEWGTEAKAGDLPITDARYAFAADHPDIEAWCANGGVAYVIKFRVPRGVAALTYSGEARPEGTAVNVGNVVQVSQNGGTTHEDVPAP